MRRMSELFTGITTMKFVNALNKLSHDSAHSNHTELAIQQWRKLAPPILSTSHCEFNGVRLCAHTQKTLPLPPINLLTKQIVPSLYP